MHVGHSAKRSSGALLLLSISMIASFLGRRGERRQQFWPVFILEDEVIIGAPRFGLNAHQSEKSDTRKRLSFHISASPR